MSDLQEVVCDVDWLWENWIPRGLVSMLAGPSGIGKTTLLHYFIKIVVTGGVWPDGSHQEPGPVVLVETESAQPLVVKHFRELEIPMDRVYVPTFDGDVLGQVDLRREKHQEQLQELCAEVHPAFIGIDSIGGSQSKGEDKVEDARPIMQYLAMLARDYRCGLVATHHFKKRAEGFDNAPLNIDLVRGSTVWVALSRSVLALSKQKGALKLQVLKSNVAPIGEPLAARFETNAAGEVSGVRFEDFEDDPVRLTEVDRCTDWLQGTLVHEGPQSPKALTDTADIAGFSRSTLFRAAEKLEDAGVLVRTGYGKATKWQLSPFSGAGSQTDSRNPRDSELLKRVVPLDSGN